ncbi:hypothetical protein Tco_1236571 [Tanacetum coccineum]
MFQDFRYSDTARLSRSVEVLKLKNFKKDETLKLSKSSNQEWNEHVGPEVTSSQDDKVSRWRKDYAWLMISRCSRSQCQIQIQGTSSILKSMITTTYSQEKVKKEDISLIEQLLYDDYASSDDDTFYSEDIDYVEASPPDSMLVSLEEVKDLDTEDGEIDTDILLTIKDDILREKLRNINLLIAKIESLNDNPTPDFVLKSHSSFPIPVKDSDFFLEKFKTFLSLPEAETL